jgi:hypothetical protein
MESKNSTLKKKVQSLEIELLRRHSPDLSTVHAEACEVAVTRYESGEPCARDVQGTVSTDSVEQTGTDSVSVLKDSSSDRSTEDWNSIWAIYERVRNCAPADLFKVVNAIRSSSDPTLAAQYLHQVSLGRLADAHVGLSNLATEYKLISSPRLPALCHEPILFAPAKPWTTITDSDRLVSHLLSLPWRLASAASGTFPFPSRSAGTCSGRSSMRSSRPGSRIQTFVPRLPASCDILRAMCGRSLCLILWRANILPLIRRITYGRWKICFCRLRVWL